MKQVLSLYDFLNRFPSEDECFQYLVEKRWPDGFRCSKCNNQMAYFIEKQRRFQCTARRHQTSVTAGTVFHRLRHPLLTLFWAAYLVATSKKGMSAMELKRKLDIRSYQTAWLLLHKIRSANEFIFRFNRRWNLDNIFDKLIVRCVTTSSFTYADLTG